MQNLTIDLNNLDDRAPHILILDDEEKAIAALSKWIGRKYRNYQISFSSSPKEALALIKKERLNLDILILDIKMPEINGKDFLRAVRHFNTILGVVFYSAHEVEDAENLAFAVEHMVSHFFHKGQFQELVVSLPKLVRQKRLVEYLFLENATLREK